MEEISKYYTPSIEELYDGFIIEEKFESDEFKKGVFKWDVVGNLTEKVRVKYLDRNDVEDLGWKHIKHEQYTYTRIRKGEERVYHLRFVPNAYNWIDIRVKSVHGLCGSHCLFEGECLNKSELKRLMSKTITYR